jgi:hypothetical protein
MPDARGTRESRQGGEKKQARTGADPCAYLPSRDSIYATRSAILPDFRSRGFPFKAFSMQALMIPGRSFLAPALSKPFPPGWQELHDLPPVAPPKWVSLNRIFPFAGSPAALAQETPIPVDSTARNRIMKVFIFPPLFRSKLIHFLDRFAGETSPATEIPTYDFPVSPAEFLFLIPVTRAIRPGPGAEGSPTRTVRTVPTPIPPIIVGRRVCIDPFFLPQVDLLYLDHRINVI